MEGDRHRREWRIRYIIIASFCLFVILTWFESRLFHLGEIDFPVSGNVLVFVLLNINLLLLLLMVFLVLRDLVQLVFERRRRLLGAKLRTKLVISFVSLAIIPTGLLFFVALQFVSTSMDYWFNINVEQSLEASLKLARTVYHDEQERVLGQGQTIAGHLRSPQYQQSITADLNGFLDKSLQDHNLADVVLISGQRVETGRAVSPIFQEQALPAIPAELLRRALAGETDLTTIQPVMSGELVRGLIPFYIDDLNKERKLLVVSRLISQEKLDRMTTISTGLAGYRQLMILQNPIKSSLLVVLFIVTLLIIFCAIWFGFYIARGLTDPIAKLADATRRVAEGELDFALTKTAGDEMGTLVDSFNQMTRDLLSSQQEIFTANHALQQSYEELDRRGRYTETILRNVAAGVIAIDENGQVTTINRFAEDLLKLHSHEMIGKDYGAILRPEHLILLEDFLSELFRSGKSSIQKPLRFTIRDETFFLRVNLTRLESETGNPIGVVLVFDNLTELEKAQRVAAWREVARRIAHEVKNPLTPIQLSAQRLRKKYLTTLGDSGQVFDLCTMTIINQVDELKRLVSEFSSFARMPVVNKLLNNLSDMVGEALALYQEGHKHITFHQGKTVDIPLFLFDFTQIKRMLINLLDNAVSVLADGGDIWIELSLNPDNKLILLKVRDNGPGVKDKDKLRLFEPYFSTKKTGTGLGLAIAAAVVAEHDGHIMVTDNHPAGTCFIVELPYEIPKTPLF